jgi:glycosyltransferase involved in cell wall biosynthesis
VIVGEGHYLADLEQLVQELNIIGNIRFLGRRSDVQTIIAASDVVVIPSVWEEAFGLIAAESMASARPVIASKIGGIPELIENGVNGFLVEPDNYYGLADALQRQLTNQNIKILFGNSGLKKSAQFDLSLAVAKLVDLYEEVL